MAIEALEQKRKQTILALIFIILLFSIIIVVFWGIVEKKKTTITTIVVPPLPAKEIEINLEILKNPALKELQAFEGAVLPAPEEKGRENPFLPFRQKAVVPKR